MAWRAPSCRWALQVAELWGRSWARQVWPCTQTRPQHRGPQPGPSRLAQGTVSVRTAGLQPSPTAFRLSRLVSHGPTAFVLLRHAVCVPEANVPFALSYSLWDGHPRSFSPHLVAVGYTALFLFRPLP